MKNLLFAVLLLVKFLGVIGQGILDPCYFWADSVYAGDGMCFKFMSKSKTFNNAKDTCKKEGTILAEPRTQRQMDTARSIISTPTNVWLGGQPSSLGSNFVWLSDGANVLSVVKGSHGIEQYLALDSSYELASEGFLTKNPFMCQISGGNPCDTYLPGAEYYENNCFLPVTQSMTLQNALTYCEKRDAKVVETDTLGLIDHLKAFAGWNFDPDSNVWIGLIQSSGRFNWRSSSRLLSTQNPYSNWAQGEPPSTLTANAAVVMNGNLTWAWSVVPETSRARVVCQRDISKECSGVFSSGRCLNMYHSASNWTEAKDVCIGQGSYLAEPKTELLDRTIERYMFDSGANFVFLGASDVEKEGEFRWDYSKQLLSDTYNNWGGHNPNNFLGGENYLEIRHEANLWGKLTWWNDIYERGGSNGNQSYICEKYIPIYTHSYLVVIPPRWIGSSYKRIARLSMASFPHQKGRNYVEIRGYPTEQLHNVALLDNEVFEYIITRHRLWLSSTEIQEKYLRVLSEAPLDVHFFLWPTSSSFVCSTLVLDEMAQGSSKTFFIPPAQRYDNLALLSTEDDVSTLSLALSADFGILSAIVNGLDLKSGNILALSTTLPSQYQSLYVESISGSTSAQMVHSTGALNVYRFAQEDATTTFDVSCEQIRPVSMIGSDYITFPSLPMKSAVTDIYTVVAVHSNTKVTVYDPRTGVQLRTVTLLWAGDVYDLELPASGFYHVNGTNIFYLYAGLTGPAGICSLALMDASLYRASYQFSLKGPLYSMDECFVVTIVETQSKVWISVSEGNGVVKSPDGCQDVKGTNRSGCYFHLTNLKAGNVYIVEMIASVLVKSTFGAYIFCTKTKSQNALCFPLGMTDTEPKHAEYDFNEYVTILESKHTCDTDSTTHQMTSDATTTPESVETTHKPITEDLTTIVANADFTSMANAASGEFTTTAPLEVITSSTSEVASTVQNTIAPSTMPITSGGLNTPDTPYIPGDPHAGHAPPPSPPSCIEGRLPNTTTTFTKEEVEESKEKIVAHLRVKQETLSSVKRSKMSVPDERVSSTTMGMGGMVFIGFVLGFVVISDIVDYEG